LRRRAISTAHGLVTWIIEMKVLVLGAGPMGYGAVFDLINNSPGVESETEA
jgi:hypothetical protein